MKFFIIFLMALPAVSTSYASPTMQDFVVGSLRRDKGPLILLALNHGLEIKCEGTLLWGKMNLAVYNADQLPKPVATLRDEEYEVQVWFKQMVNDELKPALVQKTLMSDAACDQKLNDLTLQYSVSLPARISLPIN